MSVSLDEHHQFRRKQIAWLAEWREGFDMTGVSISEADKANGSPKTGDMIARNPENHADRWLVAAKYFAENFEPAQAIDNAELPEPVAFVNRERWDSGDHWPDDCFSDVKTGDIEQPLYGPEVAERLAAAEEALTRCKRNSGVTMDELGEMRDERDIAESRLKAITEALRDDSLAASFQTMGQYRTALLRRETAKNQKLTLELQSLISQSMEKESDIERIKELLRESYEVYAGMEGTPIPQTACEAYLLRIIMEMQKPLSAALLAEFEKENK